MESSNISRLELVDENGEPKEIILIGTAHVSPKSVELVKATIDEERPDTVCIELDPGRFQTVTQKRNTRTRI